MPQSHAEKGHEVWPYDNSYEIYLPIEAMGEWLTQNSEVSDILFFFQLWGGESDKHTLNMFPLSMPQWRDTGYWPSWRPGCWSVSQPLNSSRVGQGGRSCWTSCAACFPRALGLSWTKWYWACQWLPWTWTPWRSGPHWLPGDFLRKS